MKKGMIWMLTAGLLLFTACGGGNDKESSSDNDNASISDAVHAASNIKKMADQAEKAEDRMKDLKKMKPVSNDVMKKVLPETLLGLKRTKYSVTSNSMMGNFTTGNATYEKDDSHSIKIYLLDGAGESGSAIYSLTKLQLSTDMEEQTEHGFSKTKEILGHKMYVELDSSYSASISTKLNTTLFHRFVVKISGNNMPISTLKKAFKALDFSPLKKASEE